MKSNNIIESWVHTELNINGKTFMQAISEMNKELYSSYTNSRVREWREFRNGRGQNLPRRVRVYMGKIALKNVLSEAGIDVDSLSTKKLNKIVERLS